MVFRKRNMTISPTNDDMDVESVLPVLALHETSSVSSGDDMPSSPEEYSRRRSRRPELPPRTLSDPQSPSEDRLSPTVTKNSLPMAYGEQVQRGRPSLLLIGFAMVGMAAVLLSRTSVNFAASQVATLSANRDQLSDKLRKTERDLSILKRELSAIDLMMEDQVVVETKPSSEANHQLQMNELGALQTRIQSLTHKSDDMKGRVKSISRQQLTEKYGAGVKQVEIELYFPDEKEGPTKFIIALEDDLMPHSSFTFLEMVSSGLLDGCSFILNALHVLKAAPLPYDGTSAAAKARAFTELGLESVAFKEYSHSVPHTKNTIGFAADGSPSFYINTEDNSEIHAGDPCFGRIIEGFDTIKRLEASPTRNGIWFARRIGIRKARIL